MRVRRIGDPTRIESIRGMSKVVTGGITLATGVLEHLAEVELPARLGGHVGSYQFCEEGADGVSRLVVRVGTAVQADDDEVRAVIAGSLATSDLGVLADRVWHGAPIRVERAEPVPSASGKVLAFQPMR